MASKKKSVEKEANETSENGRHSASQDSDWQEGEGARNSGETDSDWKHEAEKDEKNEE